ncbi:DUF6254 family protein [Bacillaceae bacterium S4-13-56]
MSTSKGQRVRKWNARKQSQSPHGKISSFDELVKDVKKKNK